MLSGLRGMESALTRAFEEYQADPSRSIVVQIDDLKEKEGCALAAALLNNMESVRQEAVDWYVRHKQVPITHPVWLRLGLGGRSPSSIPPDLVHTKLLKSRPGSLVVFDGTVMALQTLTDLTYARTMLCPCCKRETVLGFKEQAPECCPGHLLLEDASLRVTIPARTAWVHPAPGDEAALAQPPVRVVFLDDLTRDVSLGDSVRVAGPVQRGALSSLDCQKGAPGLTSWALSVCAVGVERTKPGAPPAHPPPCIPPTPEGLVGLDTLLDSTEAWVGRGACHRPALLATLVSAAAAGAEHRGVGQALPRRQVHLALATPGWDPRVHGSLRTLARRLTPVGIDASTGARQLLPLALGRQGAEGGSLAAAGPGVLLLDAGACSVRAGTSLMACLGAGDRLRVVADAPDLDLHATATLWLHLAATDFGRSCYDHISPLELLARKYGRDAPLVFDVLVACPDPQAPAMAARLEDLLQAPDESERAAMTPDDLAQHMRVAQGLGQPRMTHEGLEALTAYFTCLRLGEEQAPQTALLSLARVAAACARLCHRAEILPVPDAAVAIALMEERLEAMGMLAMRWEKWREAWLVDGRPLDSCLNGLLSSIQAETAAWLVEAEE
ncbi:hypothetical protein ACKKBG_A37815 [Auxenochlorella protothecoides x Auxenochlorella symbiontica]